MTTGFSSLRAAEIEIKKNYFGIHMFYPGGEKVDPRTTASSIPVFFGGWRFHTAQRLSWRDMAGSDASKPLDFSVADVYMHLAARSGMSVLWTLGSSTPSWAAAAPKARALSGLEGSSSTPAKERDWLNYVEQVVRRYPKKIEAVEIWNEPDTTDDRGEGHSYHGTMRQLVQLTCSTYKLIKQIDPAILVVSPSFTGDIQVISRLKRFLQLGGGKCIDVLGFHSYEYQGSGPFHLVHQLRQVKKSLAASGLGGMPIWNTEFGLLIQNAESEVKPASKWGGLNTVYTETEAAALATKYLMWGAVAGLDRFYWFAWDSRTMGLTRRDRQQPNSAGIAVKALIGWTVGQRISQCSQLAESLGVQCKFNSSQEEMIIVWPDKKIELPRGARAETIRGEVVTGPSVVGGNGLPVKITSRQKIQLREAQ